MPPNRTMERQPGTATGLCSTATLPRHGLTPTSPITASIKPSKPTNFGSLASSRKRFQRHGDFTPHPFTDASQPPTSPSMASLSPQVSLSSPPSRLCLERASPSTPATAAQTRHTSTRNSQLTSSNPDSLRRTNSGPVSQPRPAPHKITGQRRCWTISSRQINLPTCHSLLTREKLPQY